MQCHRPKSKSTLDVSMVYREDMARDASKQLRLGAEDMGFFVVNGLVPRLKESNMLQLGNTVSAASQSRGTLHENCNVHKRQSIP